MEAAAPLAVPPPAPSPARPGKAKKLLMAVGTTAAVLVLGIGGYWAYTHPTVRIVNASSTKSLTVFVDDQQVAAVEAALKEDDAATSSASTQVASGEHTLTAKDAAGTVVDSRAVTIQAGKTYLYAPAHSKQVCWTFQTDGYGDVQVDEPLVPLDPGESFWQLPSSPDFWFQDTPDSVKTSKKSKGSKKTAVRQHACEDGEPAP